ncbi:DUF2922 domain-containing protein [Veillonella agrestimuris]|uniref:DUF2922 domain-containing protein n=1 Tax=Veillonella agrestimuris TaxID=2941340 RepID=UPI00203E6518|nr:DUF2922 domain-containing protein [Veillonella agrestimuris]
MADKRVVYLKFTTVDGKNTSISISAPRAGLTLAEARKAANVLLAHKVVLGAGDTELSKFISANEVTTQTTPLV